ncbi:MAG: hypothetical protein A2Y71_03095 [Bacteroidetes bacterium RBG_13_42_15]|nr:MAG: hypothetical protein A2Y71_03095 [Bacteroidetes bacterium RBG_13_42_15]
MEKPEEKVLHLYQKIKKPYRELDYFILKMIKLNAHSKTAPFRFYFFERVPIDANTDPLQMIWIPDQVYDPEEDVFANNFLSDLRLLRLAIDRTDLSTLEKGIINWKLLGNENIKDYPYAPCESPGELYGNFSKGRQKITETFHKLKMS